MALHKTVHGLAFKITYKNRMGPVPAGGAMNGSSTLVLSAGFMWVMAD